MCQIIQKYKTKQTDQKTKPMGPTPEAYVRVFGTVCRFHTQVLMGQGDPSLQPLLEAELGSLPSVHGGLRWGDQERLAADEVGLPHGLL